jgi:hypothetical protein
MSSRERWRGLLSLLGDAVEHMTTAIERIHMQTAQRPFDIIEQIPGIAAPAHIVHEVHDSLVKLTYTQIRFWNGAVQTLAQVALADDPEPPTDANS